MRSKAMMGFWVPAITALVAGCATPHRDVILFGTQTQLAIDVSETTATTSPQFSVGYKRVEFVSLPLLVNGVDSKVCDSAADCHTAGIKDAKYIASGGYQQGAHSNPIKETDAYSVFASFGAKFGGGNSGTGGGLAQYFATGVAAQNLGHNPQVYRTLSVKGTTASQQDLEQANTALVAALGQTKADAKVESGKQEAAAMDTRISAIVALSETGGKLDAKKWATNVNKLKGTSHSAYIPNLLKYSSAAEIKAGLHNNYPAVVAPLFAAITQ